MRFIEKMCIRDRLKAKILAGVYPPGGHLDSVRDMAAAAGVNPNTMQRALAQLEAEGLVYTCLLYTSY